MTDTLVTPLSFYELPFSKRAKGKLRETKANLPRRRGGTGPPGSAVARRRPGVLELWGGVHETDPES